ncbi:MAG: general secretion pathway protein GspB [Gammaproteobacteria bacterium]
MSYILDALRKSDRERAGDRPLPDATGAVPGFRAAPPPPRRRRLGLIAAGVALLAGLGAGVWIGQRAPAPDPGPAPAMPDNDAGTASTPASAVTPAELAVAAPPATLAEPANPEEAPERPAGILELWQLTEAEQRYLQALDVTLHVHSSDPAQRAVIINGLRAREGQELGEALRLAEIVPDGLILEFQGQLVHLPNPQPY